MESGYITELRAGKYFQRKCFSKILGSKIKVLPREIDFETGEEKRPYINLCTHKKEFMNTNKTLSLESVKKRCKDCKWLIKANEENIKLFVTLTYAENMTDNKRLYQDFRKFWQRFKDKFPYITGYLVAFEPQERGAWHAHILFLSDKKNVFISNKKISQIWGFGFTKTKSTRNITSISNYLLSYLCFLSKGKKGSRLHMYPKNFRFFRVSKNVNKILKKSFNGFLCLNIPSLFNSELLQDTISIFSFEKQNEKIACRTILFIRTS